MCKSATIALPGPGRLNFCAHADLLLFFASLTKFCPLQTEQGRANHRRQGIGSIHQTNGDFLGAPVRLGCSQVPLLIF